MIFQRHVIDWTIRQAKQAGYDKVAALLDTDTDWTPTVQKLAKTNKIIVLASDPCFEAMLLRLIEVTPELDTKRVHLNKRHQSPIGFILTP